MLTQTAHRLLLALVLTPLGCKTQQPETTTPIEATPDAAPKKVTDEPEVAQREYPVPPALDEPKRVAFPATQSFQLDNGLPVYVVENHEVPLLSVQVVIHAGDMDGAIVPSLTASMLAEGTASRSKASIDQSIESVGGSIGTYATMHATIVAAEVLKKDAKLAMTLLADEIQHPAFLAASLEKLKQNLKTATSVRKSQPRALANRLFRHVAYPQGHPYGRLFPENEEIDAVQVSDLRDFHAAFYHANNAFILLAGDITPDEAKTLTNGSLGRWRAAPPDELPPNPLNQFTSYEVNESLTVHLVDRPGSAQADLVVGNLALARKHEDWIKLHIVDSILGGLDGRLFGDIREKRGLTYNIRSSVSETQAPGVFMISTRTRTQTAGALVHAVFEHVDMIRSAPPSDEEMQATLDQLVGSFPLELETAGQIADKTLDVLLYDLPMDYWSTYRDKLLATPPGAVHEAARKYIHPIPHVVIVGTADEVEPQVQETLPKAKIVRYNTDLQPL